ncbi:MAG: hypothetical protein K8T26_16155 [Lentisphaerae bacterium]|nr:hypothetical protein [Lentisphaerota bacterium]
MSSARVAEVVWPWRQSREPVAAPAPRMRATLEALVMVTVALVLKYGFDKVWVPRVVLTLAAFVFLTGLFVPALYHRFHRGMLWLGKMTGSGMTWLLLVPFFFICFPIGRLLFALRGRDPLNRKYDPQLDTYWIKHRSPESVERYRQQF